VHADLPVEGSLKLAQGEDRLLWIAGSAGVVRFDGVEFRSLAELDGMVVRDLAFDASGGLWIATTHALYRARGLAVERVAAIDESATEHIDLLPDPISGTVWLATPAGLLRWQGQAQLGPADAVVSGVFYTLGTDTGGRPLAGDREGLLELKEDGGRARRATLDDLVYTFVDLGAAGLWSGGYHLRRLHEGRVAETAPGIEFVRVISALSNGELWVGTHGRGLWIRSPEGRWRPGERRLAGEMITAISEDRDRNVWVATEAGDLHQFALSPMTLTTADEGLGGQLLAALAPAPDGGLWAAIYGVGIQEFAADGRPLRALEACQGDTRALAMDASGVLWIGGRHGLFRLEGEQVVPAGYPQLINGLWAAEEGLWLAGEDHLRLWRDGRILREYGPQDGLAIGMQPHFLATADGGLWIGSQRGLQLLRAGRHLEPPVLKEGVRALAADEAGGLWWLGSGVLGHIVDGSLTGRVEVEPRHWLVVADGADGLWLLGSRGASRFPRSELRAALGAGRSPPKAARFGRAHGIEPLREVSIGSPLSIRLADGRLAIGAYGKLAIGALEGALAPSAPVLAELELRDREGVLVDTRLAATQLPVTMAYTAANYRDAERQQFRHRLWPIEAEWSAPSVLRQRSYGGLAAGDYRFEVQALGAEGGALSEVVARSFVVLPRWHERFVARLGLAGFLLLALALLLRSLLRWRLRRFSERQRELEGMVNERTRQLAAANQELERLARSDALTGLLNRRGFEERVAAAWSRYAEGGHGLALVALDVDHFKAYNDHYGHAEGDACLRAVGHCLAAETRASEGIAARIGGEEFVVLIPGADTESARRWAEELRAGVEARALPHAGNPGAGVVTISLGVALAGPGDAGWEAALARADSALYEAKRGGRNRVAMAS
jgi:diguanylate cyclase (GGDEF)-like protein